MALGPPRRDLEKCHAFALCTDTVSTFKFVHFVLCLLSSSFPIPCSFLVWRCWWIFDFHSSGAVGMALLLEAWASLGGPTAQGGTSISLGDERLKKLAGATILDKFWPWGNPNQTKRLSTVSFERYWASMGKPDCAWVFVSDIHGVGLHKSRRYISPDLWCLVLAAPSCRKLHGNAWKILSTTIHNLCFFGLDSCSSFSCLYCQCGIFKIIIMNPAFFEYLWANRYRVSIWYLYNLIYNIIQYYYIYNYDNDFVTCCVACHAGRYGMSTAQLELRWETQRGVVPVTATCTKDHAVRCSVPAMGMGMGMAWAWHGHGTDGTVRLATWMLLTLLSLRRTAGETWWNGWSWLWSVIISWLKFKSCVWRWLCMQNSL